MLCPSDTPEGASCGLVKNLALLCHVTSQEDPKYLEHLCVSLGVVDNNYLSGQQIYAECNYIVALNGRILGVHAQPDLFVSKLRQLRRKGIIGRYVSVFTDDTKRSVVIASDDGRVCRPLIIVTPDGESLITNEHIMSLENGLSTFNTLVEKGLIEFIDVNESNDTLIALKEEDIIPGKTTHLEIDPLTLLGIVAGLIPYPHHNQSPRNTYQCKYRLFFFKTMTLTFSLFFACMLKGAMGKQAIGTMGMNQLERIDTLLYLMIYPQKQLVTTRTLDMIDFDNLPAGQNATVAVMSYSGYDIEDAIVLNKASLDRGFGGAMCCASL